MKSIIQEASSIQKAIEKAWIKADKPREFSIRILEEPVKNFLGFTKKMAKIALFFGGPVRDGRPSGQHRYRRRHHRRPHYQDQNRQDNQGQRQYHHQRPQQHSQASSTPHDNRVNDNNDNSNNGSSE